jgi:hypothetical protein
VKRLPVAVPLTISEAGWQQIVMDTARVYGWLAAHFRPAKTQTGRWITPMSGDVGFPDLVLCRRGEVIVAELKRQRTKPTPGQVRWLAELGGHGRLWRPQDFPEVLRELRDGPDVERETA